MGLILRAAVTAASVWFTAYPLSLITRPDESFLTALASLSEHPGMHHAVVAEVPAEDVFATLGWGWDGPRAATVYRNLQELVRERHVEEVVFTGQVDDDDLFVGDTVRVEHLGHCR